MELRYIGRESNDHTMIIKVGNIEIGGKDCIIVAGPCSIENERQIIETAYSVKKSGAGILRGGAFKPRTSPYSFQGLGKEGLELLHKAGHLADMPVISEVMDTRDVELVSKYVDIIQIGSRNMQNYSLLKEIGKSTKPIMLKRGMAATIEEWLYAAEYIASEGNSQIILCERGIRTFEGYTRNTLDLMAIPICKQMSKLPVFVDPSHGTGRRDLISYASRAAIAVGANGLILEVHPCPDQSLSDPEQSIGFKDFENICRDLRAINKALIN